MNRSSKCPQFGSRFASYAGRRLHQRDAHPEEYHDAEVQRLAARPNARWDGEEVALMVAFERAHLDDPGLNETIHMEVLPQGKVEAIMGKRTQASYRRVLKEGPTFSSDAVPPDPRGSSISSRWTADTSTQASPFSNAAPFS